VCAHVPERTRGCFSHLTPQALEAIRQLKERFPIARAHMGIRVVLPGKEGKACKAQVAALFAVIDSDEWTGDAAEIVRSIAMLCTQIRVLDKSDELRC
jgi:ribosome maturation protein Sdo1